MTMLYPNLCYNETFITFCFGSIAMDPVISELCYKGTILQRNFPIIPM